jgi:hypothetical protein
MPTITEKLTEKYGNVVEGPLGLKMPEATARAIETIAKDLPKDFTYRRSVKAPSEFVIPQGSRADISTITTDSKDRDGEVVLPGGLNFDSYNKVVPWCHDYTKLPVGTCGWMKKNVTGRGIVARTDYPVKPKDWTTEWMPDAILHMMAQPTPGCVGKSIGFIPLSVRQATPDEKVMRPEWKDAPIIDRASVIEYSVCPIGANQDATMISVSKCLADGTITREFAESLGWKEGAASEGGNAGNTVPDDNSMPPCPGCKSAADVRKKDDGGMYECMKCQASFSAMKTESVPAPEPKAIPFVRPETIAAARKAAMKQLQDRAAEATRLAIANAIARARGRVS